jgi:Family of unknown function (DUF6308)
MLTEREAWRSRIINSRLTNGERDEVIERAVGAPWASVPADADLADADPAVAGGLFASAAGLYWAFTWPHRISGVAVAKVHKILHLERPGLYPILDDRIKGLYEPCTATWPERLPYLEGVAASASPPYWAAFREDLIRNHDPLEVYRTRWQTTKTRLSASWPNSPGYAFKTSSRGSSRLHPRLAAVLARPHRRRYGLSQLLKAPEPPFWAPVVASAVLRRCMYIWSFCLGEPLGGQIRAPLTLWTSGLAWLLAGGSPRLPVFRAGE